MSTGEFLDRVSTVGANPTHRVIRAGRTAEGQAGAEARKAAALAELETLEPILAEAEAEKIRVKSE